MSLFDTLFPPRTRRTNPGAASRGTARRSRGRHAIQEAEPLERRRLFAITPVTTDQFFVDSTAAFAIDSQYAEFSITRPSPISDAWVKVEAITPNPTVGFGPAFNNNEDGLYHVGQITTSTPAQAFIYFTTKATTTTTINDEYRITLYDGLPSPANVVEDATFYFKKVVEAQKNAVNKISTITFNTPDPVIGGTLTMTVTGKIGNSPDRVLFTPASRHTWLPDVYRLESVNIAVPPAFSGSLLYYDPAPNGAVGNPFTATYTFRIEGYNTDTVFVEPTQFTQQKLTGWEHHDILDFPAPPIPRVKPKVDLKIEKTDFSDCYTPGANVTYTVTVTNLGTSAAAVEGVKVTDPLPPNTTFVSGSTGVSFDGTTVTYTTKTIAVNGSESFTFTIGTQPDATEDLVNTATATPPDTVKSSSTFSTDSDESCPQLILAVTKTDGLGVDTYIPGSPVTYTIVVTNTGVSTLVDGVFKDSLPGVATSGSWTTSTSGGATVTPPSSGPGVNDIDALVTIPKNGSVTFTYTVQTDPTAVDDLVNTATVTASAAQGSASASSTDTDTATPTADLVVTKSRLSAAPVAGQTVTYQITVTNAGPSSITLFTGTDITTPALLSPSYTVSTGDYNATTGIWTADPGEWFDPTEVVTFTLTGTVPADVTGLLVNTATAKPPEGVVDPIPENNTSTVTDVITVLPTLSISKTDGKSTYVPGTSTTYTIVATNSGPSFLANGTVTDPLPVQVASAQWTAAYTGVGSTGPDSGSGGLDETVSLAVGGTATFTFTVQIKPDATGDLVNIATITPPPTTQGIPATTTDTNTEDSPQVALFVTKDDGRTSYLPGDTLVYKIVVSNSGPSFLKGATLKDSLPTPQGASGSWTVSSVTGVNSAVTPASGGNDILATVDLAPNGTATILYTVVVSSTAFGQLDNTVTLTPPTGVKVDPTSVLQATDSNFGPAPPQSVVGGLVVGTDDGCNGLTWVRVIDPLNQGQERVSFVAYGTFRGSVRVAAGDLDGDKVDEIVTAPGRSRVGEIRVFDSKTGKEKLEYRFLPFGSKYRGGVEVAVADLNKDGIGDIIAGMSSGSGTVSAFLVDPNNKLKPVAGNPFASFRGFPPTYSGGVKLAAADFGSFSGGTWVPGVFDGIAEIAVGSNAGRKATVRIVDVSGTPTTVRTIQPIGTKFTGGVTLSVGRWEPLDPVPSLFVGAGVGGKSIVDVYSGSSFAMLTRLKAFSTFAKPNATVFVAPLDISGDGVVDNLYGVQGLNGGGGTKGVRDFQRVSGTTNPLSKTTNSLFTPPLRIVSAKLAN